jgi:ankyrin repeat protein
MQDEYLKWTALHQAAARGHTAVTRLLLEGKADVQSLVGSYSQLQTTLVLHHNHAEYICVYI